MWHGKPFAELTDVELEHAIMFFESVLNEIRDHAPVATRAFFQDQLSNATLARVNKLVGAK